MFPLIGGQLRVSFKLCRYHHDNGFRGVTLVRRVIMVRIAQGERRGVEIVFRRLVHLETIYRVFGSGCVVKSTT